MTNVFEEIGEKVLHVIEAPFKYAGKVESVLKTAINDQPELKAGIIKLVALGETAVGDGGVVIGERGLVIPQDMKTFSDLEAFFSFLKGDFFPLVEKVYGEFEADLNKPSPAIVTTNVTTKVSVPTAKVEALADTSEPLVDHTPQAGPGLHTATKD
jgi:hypothetical protein